MSQTRWPRYAARLGAVLVVAAGAAWLWAAVQRWWPECRLDRYESMACIRRQDHEVDYLWPTEPWVPIGSTALVAGLGCLLAALGLLLVVPSLTSRSVRGVVAVALVLQAGVLVPVGAATYLSGRAGRPVEDVPALVPAGLLWALLLPAVLAFTVPLVIGRAASRRQLTSLVALVVALLLTSPLLDYVLMSMTYTSHDTPPWSGLFSGAALVVAGVAAWWVPEPAPSGGERDREGRVAGVAV
ncbi:hypothetical protein P0Y31_01720 [Knoellia sp. 3-2P3]|uniref:hypothetical protein n=1 Tax=unclassified Knoellia TaxID=2618719 RepID=UPI0023D9F304|nr:hypothetical protein [Knoellia sp. 3-2P3]MDF2091049.1 hypothetical protein [Knoellia sp. 3-2P3]